MTDPDDAPKTLEELTSAGTTVMFALTNAGPIESRPLTIAEIGADRLSILVDDTAAWLQGMSPGAGAHLTISDVRSNTFVSLTGGLISMVRAAVGASKDAGEHGEVAV
jgi:hypothetical protein